MSPAHYNLALLYARTKEPAKAQEQMRIVETLKTGRRSTSGVVVLPLISELASDSHFQNNLRHLCNLWITCGVVLCAIRHFFSEWRPNSETRGIRFVGNKACVDCHPREAAQLNTPMAQALKWLLIARS